MNQLQENDLHRVLEVIRHAVEYDEKGDTAFALRILTAVVEEFPALALGHSYLGLILSRCGEHPAAIQATRLAVKLEPTSERVSLLLFRVLWAAGERDLAMEEMRRFQAIGHSEEYAILMEEWKRVGEL